MQHCRMTKISLSLENSKILRCSQNDTRAFQQNIPLQEGLGLDCQAGVNVGGYLHKPRHCVIEKLPIALAKIALSILDSRFLILAVLRQAPP